jgi:hypothetical protein
MRDGARATSFRLAGTLFFISLAGAALAQPSPAARYQKTYQESQEAWQRQPTNAVLAWQFSRACYDCVEIETNETRKVELARQGIATARESVRLAPALAAAHYYLGMNLGRLADLTRNLSGLKLVSEMERAFKKALELEAGFDYAGPDRCLGLLYRDAPGWPISVGSRPKARQHLEQARDRASGYPDNQLNLLEAWLKWGEKRKAQSELGTTTQALTAARQKLTGEEWTSSWADWDRRWKEIQARTAEVMRSAGPHKGW